MTKTKCEHFQQNFLKIYPFSSSKLHKGVNIEIRCFKTQKLRQFMAVKTKILVPVACLRCLSSSQAAMKRLRHVDVTIHGLPDGGLSFLLPGCQKNVLADDKLFVHYIQNCVARQQHVYLLQEVKRSISVMC